MSNQNGAPKEIAAHERKSPANLTKSDIGGCTAPVFCHQPIGKTIGALPRSFVQRHNNCYRIDVGSHNALIYYKLRANAYLSNAAPIAVLINFDHIPIGSLPYSAITTLIYGDGWRAAKTAFCFGFLLGGGR